MLGERWAASVNLCVLVGWEVLFVFVNNCRICCVWVDDCAWLGRKAVAARNCWAGLVAVVVAVVGVNLSKYNNMIMELFHDREMIY